MRNLLRFLWKYSNFVLFLALEVYCMVLVFSYNSFQRAGWINSSNAMIGNFYTSIHNINAYFKLRETNEQLARENALLRSKTMGAYARYNNHITTVQDTVYKQQYSFVHAEVVNNSVNRRNNFLTINKGIKHGIKSEMAVISPEGIVGITKDVSANFASVLSILNKDAKISAKVKKAGEIGSLVWEGGDYRFGTLKDIGTHVKIKKGDTITTNNYSAIFPDNLPIGVVESFTINEGGEFYTIKVKYTASLKNLSYVYVVNNKFRTEQKQLEENSQHD